MPSTSEKQRRFMGAALGRERAGESLASDPKMSDAKLADFARKPVKKAKGRARGNPMRYVGSMCHQAHHD
jgi:hypothetical protein